MNESFPQYRPLGIPVAEHSQSKPLLKALKSVTKLATKMHKAPRLGVKSSDVHIKKKQFWC
jgi:hypothetical protein